VIVIAGGMRMGTMVMGQGRCVRRGLIHFPFYDKRRRCELLQGSDSQPREQTGKKAGCKNAIDHNDLSGRGN
jgi:hypothetical protein